LLVRALFPHRQTLEHGVERLQAQLEAGF